MKTDAKLKFLTHDTLGKSGSLKVVMKWPSETTTALASKVLLHYKQTINTFFKKVVKQKF